MLRLEPRTAAPWWLGLTAPVLAVLGALLAQVLLQDPGYVLVRMDLTTESWRVVRDTPGVTGFVGHSHQPVPLSMMEVENMLAPAIAAQAQAQGVVVVQQRVQGGVELGRLQRGRDPQQHRLVEQRGARVAQPGAGRGDALHLRARRLPTLPGPAHAERARRRRRRRRTAQWRPSAPTGSRSSTPVIAPDHRSRPCGLRGPAG